jgi:hypothetical protein
MNRIRPITFLLLGLPAASGNAQTPSSASIGVTVGREITSGPLRLAETLRALRDSQMVRSVAVGLGRSQGRVLEHSDTLLTLASEGGAVRVPAASIDSLWVRGSSLKKGLAWGAAVGVLSGFAAGVLINQTFCQGSDSGCDDDDLRVIMLTGGLGLAAGTVVGALVGAVIPKWQRRWP